MGSINVQCDATQTTIANILKTMGRHITLSDIRLIIAIGPINKYWKSANEKKQAHF